MADPSYPLFSIFSFLGFILVLVPLPWHFQAWNSGTCLFMMWTAIGCLNFFINSIVWHNNAIDWTPIWCDISTRLTVGISVAIPAASLCINRRLYKIASGSTISNARQHKRRAVMFDLAIGLGIPFLQMPLQFIVQGHRYDIWEDIGCYPTTVNTPPAYPLSFVWPNVIAIISAVYCTLTLRAFMKHRARFSEFLSCNSTLTINRYFRLMSIATIELLFSTPISAYNLYLNASMSAIYPWLSWSDIHLNWYHIGTFPSVLWRFNPKNAVPLELSRWSVVFCAFVFFALFGFAEESRKHCRLAYWAVAKRFGVVPPSLLPSAHNDSSNKSFALKNTTGSLPVFVSQPPLHHPRISLASSVARNSLDESDYTLSIYQSPPEYKLDLTVPPSPSASSSHYSAKHSNSRTSH